MRRGNTGTRSKRHSVVRSQWNMHFIYKYV